jgi:hypothetical protein
MHERSDLFLEIWEREKKGQADQPTKKVRGRGAVRADGISDFNPDSKSRGNQICRPNRQNNKQRNRRAAAATELL